MRSQDATANYEGLPPLKPSLRARDQLNDIIMYGKPDANSYDAQSNQSLSRFSTPSFVGNYPKTSRISQISSLKTTISSTGRRSAKSAASSSKGHQGLATLERGRELYSSKKFREAFLIFDKLAQAKDVAAMYYKAVMLLDGLGIPESAREGLLALKKTFEESARTPGCDPEYRHLTCYQIGLAYIRGVGARQDSNEAVRWWLKAATEVEYDPGSRIAFENQLNTESGTLCQILLGRYYSNLRPNPDWKSSYYWYKEAAQNGSVESMFQVGILTWYGLGCNMSDEAEIQKTIQTFFCQAARAGNICAMGNLSMYCLEKKLQEGAFLWATKAIETVTAFSPEITLAVAIKKIMTLPNNQNDAEDVKKSISISYFVLAHLHNVGAVASLDKEKASQFLETASNIDSELVKSFTNLLEIESTMKKKDSAKESVSFGKDFALKEMLRSS